MTVKRRPRGKTGHSYQIDGSKVPGVTSILGETLPKGGLTDWSARCAADEYIDFRDELAELRLSEAHDRLRTAYRHRRDEAAKRGTEIHRLAAALNDGEDVDPPEELRGHVETYRDFLDVMDVAPLVGGIELVVASRTFRYCGTADLVADLAPAVVAAETIPAARWLLELKSSRRAIYPDSALQGCGYVNAEVFVHPDHPDDEQPMDLLGIERCGVVWIKSDAWELRPVDVGPDTWTYFQHLRWLYDRRNDKDAWLGAAAAPAELEPV
jgi:hypothetical protein